MPSIITGATLRQQHITVQQRGMTSTIQETWDVTVDDLAATIADVLAAAGIPVEVRARHDGNLTDYVCTRIGGVQRTVGVWEITADYTTRSGSEDHCSISRRSGSRQVDLWQYTVGVLPALGAAPWPPSAAVTGVSLDMFGTPRSYRSCQVDISIDVYYDRTHDAETYLNAMHWPDVWDAALYRRNSVAFLHYAEGTVVFLGYSEQLTEDPWVTATLHFKVDGLFHLEQRALPSIDGHLLLSKTSTWASKVIMQLGTCYWYQPYDGALINFEDLHSGKFSEALTPTPAWIP